jgi:hypothetical protein
MWPFARGPVNGVYAFRHTMNMKLALAFTGVALAACLPLVIDKTATYLDETDRQAVFAKANAYNTDTDSLYRDKAIPDTIYLVRKGDWQSCSAENTVYLSKLQNGDRDEIKSEKEIFSRACTLPDLR